MQLPDTILALNFASGGLILSAKGCGGYGAYGVQRGFGEHHDSANYEARLNGEARLSIIDW